jgi:putative membrane protein
MFNKIFIGKSFENHEEIILRDYLALERTKLANESTLLSYIRTGLYLLIASATLFTVKNFGNLNTIATICSILSLSMFVVGIYRYSLLNFKLKKHYEN